MGVTSVGGSTVMSVTSEWYNTKKARSTQAFIKLASFTFQLRLHSYYDGGYYLSAPTNSNRLVTASESS